MAARRRESLDAVSALMASSPSSASRGRSKREPAPASRVLVHECVTRDGKPGLCKVCGWEGKRIPRAWLEERAGAPYPGKSKLLGAKVRLRGDDVDSTVVSLATPLGGTLFQTGRQSKRAQCQGAYIVSTPFGRGHIETAVPKSTVRERRRQREGNCPDAGVYSPLQLSGLVKEMERDAAKYGGHPFDRAGAELPFPHRLGSSACCGNSPVAPAALDKLVKRYRDEGEEQDFERAARAVRKALPKDLRATMPLESSRDLAEGVKAVRDHCWGFWKSAEERAKETRKDFQRKARELQKERERLGLGSGSKVGRSRVFDVPDLRAAEMERLALSFDPEAF